MEAGEDPAATLGNREESEDNDMLGEMLEDLFAAVMEGTDPSDHDRLLHLMFRLLPSQKRYGLLTNISLCAINREKFVKLKRRSISRKRYKSQISCQ